jgi:hypothetical protein
MMSDQKLPSNDTVDSFSAKRIFQIPFLFLLILMVSPFAYVENTEPTQKPEINSYYYLKNQQLHNFSCFISTDYFGQFQENQGDTSQVFPLKVVWTRNGKLYYILQSFNGQNDVLNHQKLMKEVLNVRRQFQEFYHNWEDFLISSPLANLPDSVKYSQNGDTIMVKFQPVSSQKYKEMMLKISVNGMLISRQERQSHEKVITWPLYQSREEGQVCLGWDSELFKNDSLIKKSTVRLTFLQNMPFLVPSQADIKTVFPGDSSTQRTVLYFQHYEFNFPLQELEVPDSSK